MCKHFGKFADIGPLPHMSHPSTGGSDIAQLAIVSISERAQVQEDALIELPKRAIELVKEEDDAFVQALAQRNNAFVESERNQEGIGRIHDLMICLLYQIDQLRICIQVNQHIGDAAQDQLVKRLLGHVYHRVEVNVDKGVFRNTEPTKARQGSRAYGPQENRLAHIAKADDGTTICVGHTT
jgi:hypothetical protein